MLDNIFSIAFLLLALSSSRADDMCSPASLPGRGVDGDASLYSFPVTLGSFILRKTCLLTRGILPVCIAFGDDGCIEH